MNNRRQSVPYFIHMKAKNILITGAAGGIGAATARLFAEAGYYVGLFDLNLAGLKQLAAAIGEERCCYRRLDVTDEADCAAAVAFFTEKTAGPLQVLFNNAGIMAVGLFEDVSLAEHRKVIDVNVNGVFNLTWHALPFMKQTTGAHIITTSSISSLIGNPELVSYSLSKRAVLSFTESLEISLARHHIRVSDILPMYVRTAMVDDHQKEFLNLQDSQVRLTPEDIAKQVLHTVKTGKFRTYIGADSKLFGALDGILPYRLKRWVLKKVIGFKDDQALAHH